MASKETKDKLEIVARIKRLARLGFLFLLIGGITFVALGIPFFLVYIFTKNKKALTDYLESVLAVYACGILILVIRSLATYVKREIESGKGIAKKIIESIYVVCQFFLMIVFLLASIINAVKLYKESWQLLSVIIVALIFVVFCWIVKLESKNKPKTNDL